MPWCPPKISTFTGQNEVPGALTLEEISTVNASQSTSTELPIVPASVQTASEAGLALASFPVPDADSPECKDLLSLWNADMCAVPGCASPSKQQAASTLQLRLQQPG